MNNTDETPVQWLLERSEKALAVIVSVWVILYALNPFIPQRQHANAVLGMGLAVYYFGLSIKKLDYRRDSLFKKADLGLTIALGQVTLLLTSYVFIEYFRWLEAGRLLVYSTLDLVVGVGLIYIVTDATFRKYGKVLGLVVVSTMIYGLVGPYLPGLLGHAGLSAEELIRRQTITMSGIYGFLLQVGATWIAIFIVFAGLIEAYGGFEYLVDLGNRIKTKSRSGVAQTAVVTSMFMGMMMGAAASNVATTGSFTIPLMKENGLSSRFAAATEAVASTGGQILPPIMGTAAFLMADILGLPFADIIIAGVVPALIFYGATALAVHFTVIGNGWYDDKQTRAELSEDFAPARAFILRGLQYILPIFVLIHTLVIKQFGPLSAGLWTIGAAVVTRTAWHIYSGSPIDIIEETYNGLLTGGRNLAPFLAILASLGIVINIFSVTGLAQRIAYALLGLSSGSLIVVLFLTMIVSLILGLGMPTPAAYVLVATILAPALVNVGLSELTAHFYLFYFALLSALTPPVALAVSIAIGISGSEFLSTVKQTLVLGGPVYVIPFLFVSQPSLLVWSYPTTLISAGLSLIAVIALVMVLTGYNTAYKLDWKERTACCGLFFLIGWGPEMYLRVAGVVLFAIVVLFTSNHSFRKTMSLHS